MSSPQGQICGNDIEMPDNDDDDVSYCTERKECTKSDSPTLQTEGEALAFLGSEALDMVAVGISVTMCCCLFDELWHYGSALFLRFCYHTRILEVCYLVLNLMYLSFSIPEGVSLRLL